MIEGYQRQSEIFKAFCDENRLQILALLQCGEKCGCELIEQLAISQPTLSHHMKILSLSGVVTARRDGKWTYYKVDQKGVHTAIELLYGMLET